jgi:cytidylate kinase
MVEKTTGAVTVVAISRQTGCRGGEIGQAVAERRGFRYIDGAMLRDASEYLLTHDPNLEQVQEKVSTWWTALAGALALGGDGIVPIDTVNQAELGRIERRIIEEIAQQNAAVIMGRGAGNVLRGRPGVVSVFLHAPEAGRIANVAQRIGVTEAKARDIVRESDRYRGGFMRALSSHDWEDARQYDLAIDTAATGVETATDLIVRLAS